MPWEQDVRDRLRMAGRKRELCGNFYSRQRWTASAIYTEGRGVMYTGRVTSPQGHKQKQNSLWDTRFVFINMRRTILLRRCCGKAQNVFTVECGRNEGHFLSATHLHDLRTHLTPVSRRLLTQLFLIHHDLVISVSELRSASVQT